jgi:hypothetical protein
MTDRWATLCKSTELFSQKIQDDNVIAIEAALNIGNAFDSLLNPPDRRRVRLYEICGDRVDNFDSFKEQMRAADAVTQMPDGRWRFGLGVVIGTEPAPAFYLRWGMVLTVRRDAILVHNTLTDGAIEYRQDAVPVAEHIYDAVLAALSADQPSKFGFLAK